MKICRKCGNPVKFNDQYYDVYEGMHWICFHFVFEHGNYDPDEPCDDPSCPWNRIYIDDRLLNDRISHIIRSESSFIFLSHLETQNEYYPSFRFQISIKSFQNYVQNKKIWLGRDVILSFIKETLSVARNREGSSVISSMSPNELELSISTKKNGTLILKYYLQNQMLDKVASISGTDEIEGEEAEAFCKFLKNVLNTA